MDVNKGDDIQPKYRSRLVAREIRRPGEESIFAPTPPLESLRTVLSLAATDLRGDQKHVRDPRSEWRTQVQMIDISRAYFNAKIDQDSERGPTFVELPAEDPDKAKGMCGELLVHLYGTRPAAEGWHDEYAGTLESLGFSMGAASACVFRHQSKRIITSAHGDDFTSSGPKVSLDWLRDQLKTKYELVEQARLGPGPQDDKEARVLNRVVRWTQQGLEYEADPRQGEKVVLDLGLEGAKSVATPGVKATRDVVEADRELPESKHTAFRGVAARGNYLAADRPELQFSCKEICRWMAKPTEHGVTALKRLGRFLEGHRRLIFKYPFQEAAKIDTYSDTDWAGCLRTRKSTSGGGLMIGGHLIKSWSSTQGPVSLSSGEAEFYGVVRASGVSLGYQALLEDLGVKLPIRVWTDSTATMGICGRQGLGKLRHVDTRSLWIQQRVRDKSIELRKVRGEVNPADLFTKHLASAERIDSLLRLFGCEYAPGRAEGAPELRRELDTRNQGILACDLVYAVENPVKQDGRVYPGAWHDGSYIADAYLHPTEVLPHCLEGDLDDLFPKATAAPELEERQEEKDPMEERGTEIGQSV